MWPGRRIFPTPCGDIQETKVKEDKANWASGPFSTPGHLPLSVFDVDKPLGIGELLDWFIFAPIVES